MERTPRKLESKIEAMLVKKHKLASRVIVRSSAEIGQLMKKLPKQWDTDTRWRHNVIFLSHVIDSKKILKGVYPKPGIEAVAYYKGTLIWSALIKKLTQTTMLKLSRAAIYQEMTVRNPNTLRKIYDVLNLK